MDQVQERDALSELQRDVASAEQAGLMDHRRAPILEAMAAFHEVGLCSFSIPAHRSGRGVLGETADVLGKQPFLDDASMHKGLDDRTGSYQILAHAQSLAADAFGADHSFFSTNGSTLSVQLAVLSAVGPGDKILVERNIHKSVVSGLVVSGAQPIWVTPELDERNSMSHCTTVDSLEDAFRLHPDAKAALVVSPTYFGAAADIRGLAALCHRHEVPLLVDDAWGAAFRFHPELPDDPISAGADLAISSFHKSITGMMQSSIINVKGDRIDLDRLKLCLDAFETTSTSAVLLAAMDGARRQMVLHGEEQLGRTLRLARRAAQELASLPHLTVLGPESIDHAGVAGFDITKVTVDLRDLGVNGFEAADWLYEHQRVAAELADHRHIMFLITVGDTDHSVDQLLGAMQALVDHFLGRPPLTELASAAQLLADAEYPVPPRDAFLGRTRNVALGSSVGEIAAEPVSPYPPGVPVTIPGQRITATIVEFLQRGLEGGMLIEGAADPSLKTIRVVA